MSTVIILFIALVTLVFACCIWRIRETVRQVEYFTGSCVARNKGAYATLTPVPSPIAPSSNAVVRKVIETKDVTAVMEGVVFTEQDRALAREYNLELVDNMLSYDVQGALRRLREDKTKTFQGREFWYKADEPTIMKLQSRHFQVICRKELDKEATDYIESEHILKLPHKDGQLDTIGQARFNELKRAQSVSDARLQTWMEGILETLELVYNVLIFKLGFDAPHESNKVSDRNGTLYKINLYVDRNLPNISNFPYLTNSFPEWNFKPENGPNLSGDSVFWDPAGYAGLVLAVQSLQRLSSTVAHEYTHIIDGNPKRGLVEKPPEVEFGLHESFAQWGALQWQKSAEFQKHLPDRRVYSSPCDRLRENRYGQGHVFVLYQEYMFFEQLFLTGGSELIKKARYEYDNGVGNLTNIERLTGTDAKQLYVDYLYNVCTSNFGGPTMRGYYIDAIKKYSQCAHSKGAYYAFMYPDLSNASSLGANVKRYYVPYVFAPMQFGFNMIRLKATAAGDISVKFLGVYDSRTGSKWRVRMVSNPLGNYRWLTDEYYGREFTITVSGVSTQDELALIVIGSPETYSPPVMKSDLEYPAAKTPFKLRYPFFVELTNLNILGPWTDRESDASEQQMSSRQFGNTIKPGSNVFIAPTAIVQNCTLEGNVRILDYAKLENSTIRGNALISGYAHVVTSVIEDDAIVTDFGTVNNLDLKALERGMGKPLDYKPRDLAPLKALADQHKNYDDYNLEVERIQWLANTPNGRVGGRARVFEKGDVSLNYEWQKTVVAGDSTVKGSSIVNVTRTMLGHVVYDGEAWTGDETVASGHYFLFSFHPPEHYKKYNEFIGDNGDTYIWYDFSIPNTGYALEKWGIIHGILQGSPVTRNNALELNMTGREQGQFVMLDRNTCLMREMGLEIAFTPNQLGGCLLFLGKAENARLKVTIESSSCTVHLNGTIQLPVNVGAKNTLVIQWRTGRMTASMNGGSEQSQNTNVTPLDVHGGNKASDHTYNYIGREINGNHYSGLINFFKIKY